MKEKEENRGQRVRERKKVAKEIERDGQKVEKARERGRDK